MTAIRTYFGIENLGLTNAQRTTLVDYLRNLGLNQSGNRPNEKNHFVTRLDNNAAIFEALFDSDNLTVESIKNRLAIIFGVSAATISHSTQNTAYGTAVTYSHGGNQKLRTIAFGFFGGDLTWETSNSHARAYLLDFASQWGNIP